MPSVGLRDFAPLPVSQVLAVFGYAALCCLVMNDTLKVVMLKWRAPGA